jgi:hypothetical protein
LADVNAASMARTTIQTIMNLEKVRIVVPNRRLFKHLDLASRRLVGEELQNSALGVRIEGLDDHTRMRRQ